MTYMGSKSKYAKYIVPILQKAIDDNNVTDYIECFVGGANVIDKIKCENKYGYDRCDYLIALLTQMEQDFSGVLKENTQELWDKGKAYAKEGKMPDDMTLAEIGAMGFFASFNNGGFSRGYARNKAGRNYYDEAYRNAEKQAPNLKGTKFKCQNYWELDENTKGAVIYLDPPYQGTQTYDYAKNGKMDYEHFWNWVRKISKDNYVFISEQNAPDDFAIVWEMQANRTTSHNNKCAAVERLFVYTGGLQ